ncbi:hypothetical protein [Corynebacterium flavescens]|uniref:Uncharacterized protein n=1 Tax=Corynebacterium flavescens TaxID=28028 RepID=A0A1L7CNR7_CORFL|nr:hypothetical protein [Corynebacterium flavescens]APT87455.1 hypothetical protein CFLV_09940 [Corynebacterium flavescens]KAA8720550.1 hypothetical protein F4V60_09650 [Corynebacterium flavescens]GEB97678.1 hypothetical protein CFL01nite_11730 [Corynebacterium flavescens]
MTINNEKAPASATNTHEGNNESDSSSNTVDTTPTLRMIRGGKSNGIHHFPYAGGTMDRNDSIALYVTIDDLYRGYEQGRFVLSEADVKAHDEESRAERRKEEERKQAARRREEREEQERLVIEKITGVWVGADDLQLELLAARRRGEDVTKWLDALVAIDDMDLKAAGLTQWGESE